MARRSRETHFTKNDLISLMRRRAFQVTLTRVLLRDRDLTLLHPPNSSKQGERSTLRSTSYCTCNFQLATDPSLNLNQIRAILVPTLLLLIITRQLHFSHITTIHHTCHIPLHIGVQVSLNTQRVATGSPNASIDPRVSNAPKGSAPRCVLVDSIHKMDQSEIQSPTRNFRLRGGWVGQSVVTALHTSRKQESKSNIALVYRHRSLSLPLPDWDYHECEWHVIPPLTSRQMLCFCFLAQGQLV